MTESARSKSHVPLEDSIPQSSLESILCTEELHRRPWRSPDYEKENRALVALVGALADSPCTILQTLAETILDITQCDSAGLSLLTRDGKTPDVSGTRFYWPVIAGMWSPHRGGGTPRNFGPCGDVLDQNRTLLFRHFERRYPYLLPVIPAAEECLLVPFHVRGIAVGTIWAIMHHDRREFDAEDDRVMASLGKFASSAYQALVHIEDLKTHVAEREKAEAELRELTEGLEEQVRARTAELQRSEERLRLGQQIARIGSFEWNVRAAVNTWTPELEAMYGLPPGGFSGTQTGFENLIHADDRAGVIKLVDYALKTGQPTEGEWRVVWPDGSVHWIAGRWQVLMNESRDPVRMIGVNIDVTERRMAEQALKQMNRVLEKRTALLQSQEQLLKIFVRHVPAAVAMLDRDMRYLQVSDRWCSDFLLDSSKMLGRSHYEIFPDIPDRWKQIHRRALAGETLRAEEDRWDREGGTTWLRWEIRPWQGLDGVPGGILIFSEDITHRKNAEEAFLGMSRKLIEAHEQERTRIGRELHDDVVQRLALVSIELEGAQDVSDATSELHSRIGALRNQTMQITNDVQLLSHELHSSKLDYLGIVGATKNFCKEFSERQKVEIDFQSHDLPTALPTELSLSLFRVLQEALRNATKHSGVKRFEVSLWGSTGEIHLTVRDLGAGFDREAAMKSTGLGLTSMQERLRLVGGELSINSQPKRGTTIHARVPFDSSGDSVRAAG
jgi:PAS domain S-box-containing protein